jgi:hypothetical protein
MPLRILTYLWTFPTSLPGLLVALGSPNRRVVDGVLEVHGGLATWVLQRAPLTGKGGASAMTLGHVVLGRSAQALDRTRTHERIHVRQAERWGPLFIPAYFAAGTWQKLRGRSPYWDNPFETEAYAKDH